MEFLTDLLIGALIGTFVAVVFGLATGLIFMRGAHNVNADPRR